MAERLAAADALASTDPTAAKKIRQAIVELYEDKKWASALVEQARAKLDGNGAAE